MRALHCNACRPRVLGRKAAHDRPAGAGIPLASPANRRCGETQIEYCVGGWVRSDHCLQRPECERFGSAVRRSAALACRAPGSPLSGAMRRTVARMHIQAQAVKCPGSRPSPPARFTCERRRMTLARAARPPSTSSRAGRRRSAPWAEGTGPMHSTGRVSACSGGSTSSPLGRYDCRSSQPTREPTRWRA